MSIADETAEGLFVGFDGVILNCISYVHMNLVIYWYVAIALCSIILQFPLDLFVSSRI